MSFVLGSANSSVFSTRGFAMHMLKNLKNHDLNGRTVQILERKEDRVLVKIIGTERIVSVQSDCLGNWVGPSLEVAARAAISLGFRVVE